LTFGLLLLREKPEEEELEEAPFKPLGVKKRVEKEKKS